MNTKNIVIYVHGKGGSAEEAEHYKPLFPDSEIIGFDYRAQTPWEEKQEIPTNFGETLSWRYLCYVRERPVTWNIPTRILYGEHDDLTSMETVSAFAKETGAELTVMPGGEHWFHTEEQMRFLDAWIK